MRKRVKRSPKLVSSTRIPMDSVGELSKSNINFRAKVKVKDSRPTLKEFTKRKLHLV